MTIEFHKLLRTKIASNVRTILAHVVGFGMTGDDENAENSEDCEVVQPVGIVARPVLDEDTEAVVLIDHDERIVIGMLRKSSTVHDVEVGETQLYSDKEPTCRIRLRADGTIEITAKSGQDIVLNGGTAKVVRVDDPVGCGSLRFLPGTGGAQLFYTPPGGAEVPVTSGTSLSGKPTDGAANVKA